jgi:hypothetical protein
MNSQVREPHRANSDYVNRIGFRRGAAVYYAVLALSHTFKNPVRTTQTRCVGTPTGQIPEPSIVYGSQKRCRTRFPGPRHAIFAQAPGESGPGATGHAAVKPSRTSGLRHEADGGGPLVATQPQQAISFRTRVLPGKLIERGLVHRCQETCVVDGGHLRKGADGKIRLRQSVWGDSRRQSSQPKHPEIHGTLDGADLESVAAEG